MNRLTLSYNIGAQSSPACSSHPYSKIILIYFFIETEIVNKTKCSIQLELLPSGLLCLEVLKSSKFIQNEPVRLISQVQRTGDINQNGQE